MLTVKDFKKYCEHNKNKNRAIQEKRYLYSNLKHYGLSSEISKEFIKKHKIELKNLNKQGALRLAGALWQQDSHEEKSFSLSILNLHKDKLDISDMPMIEKIMRESKGWELLDNSIIPFMYEILKKDKKAYKYLKRWIKDDDFWVRRSAMLAQLLFFRDGNGGDKQLFFDFAKAQFDEAWIEKVYGKYRSDPRHPLHPKRAKFFIRKAIGWVLREMGGKDPKSASEFLKKYKNKMGGLSFRDGSRRLPEKYKRFLEK